MSWAGGVVFVCHTHHVRENMAGTNLLNAMMLLLLGAGCLVETVDAAQF